MFEPCFSVKLHLVHLNINIHSPWMLSLEIYGYVFAGDTNDQQTKCRRPPQAAASKDVLNEKKITSHNVLQVYLIFGLELKVFIYLIVHKYLKLMRTVLPTNMLLFFYTFQCLLHHMPLKEFSVCFPYLL